MIGILCDVFVATPRAARLPVIRVCTVIPGLADLPVCWDNTEMDPSLGIEISLPERVINSWVACHGSEPSEVKAKEHESPKGD
jgi:hypothetical protein